MSTPKQRTETDLGDEPQRKTANCELCGKKFSRSDAAFRHLRVCPLRQAQLAPLPGPRRRGKRRHACDYCAKSKLSCDSDFPCETCLASRRECTYERLRTIDCQNPDDNEDCATTISLSSHTKTKSAAYTSNKISSLMKEPTNKAAIPFLSKYINPDIKKLPEVFSSLSLSETDSPDTRKEGFQSDIQATLPWDKSFPRYSFAGLLFEISPGFEDNRISSSIDKDTPLVMDNTFTSYRPMMPERYHRFINEIAQLSLTECRKVEPPERRLKIFLPPEKIAYFVSTYFREWQPHSPIIHPASFDINRASFPLLLAVVLVGILYSSDENSADFARGIFPLAEKWIFRERIFADKLTRNKKPRTATEIDDSTEDLQAIQAAFVMAKILLREGGQEKKYYVQSAIFDRIIAAARIVSLTHTKSPLKKLGACQLDKTQWQDICLAETRIRLACGIFNHDASFTIFNNMTPRLLSTELDMDMPCPVHIFNARDLSDCAPYLVAEVRPNLPRLSSLVALYWSDEWVDVEAVMIPELTVLHHWVIMLALLQQWTIRHHNGSNQLNTSRMQTALQRWKTGWDICSGPLAPEDVGHIGFIRHAAIEMWHVANKSLGMGL